MNISWIRMDKRSIEYNGGVESFIQIALSNVGLIDKKLRCPCVKYGNIRSLNLKELRAHMFINKFEVSCTTWNWHRVILIENSSDVKIDTDKEDITYDSDNIVVHELLNTQPDEQIILEEILSEEIVNNMKQPLYPEYKKYIVILAIMKLFKLKAANSWSDKSFKELLELLRNMLPQSNKLPKSMYEAKNIIRK